MNEEELTDVPANDTAAQDETNITADPSTGETQDNESETQEQNDKPKKEFWAKKRIDELTREKYEAKREAEQIRAEAQQLREALQQGQQEQPPGDIESLVQQEAERIVQERSFNDACNRTYEAGKAEFKDFDTVVSNLNMVGVTRDFYDMVSSSDVGAKLLHHLGNDLDEAARISSLHPVKMARELTLLEIKLKQLVPKKDISKAPEPIKPISAAGATSKDPAKMSDNEFAKWRREQIAQRR